MTNTGDGKRRPYSQWRGPLWVISGHCCLTFECPLCPRKRTSPKTAVTSALCQKRPKCAAAKLSYSITSSAIATSVGGGWRPSTFAVLRFIASSNLSGNCKGRSAGFAPFRMRST